MGREASALRRRSAPVSVTRGRIFGKIVCFLEPHVCACCQKFLFLRFMSSFSAPSITDPVFVPADFTDELDDRLLFKQASRDQFFKSYKADQPFDLLLEGPLSTVGSSSVCTLTNGSGSQWFKYVPGYPRLRFFPLPGLDSFNSRCFTTGGFPLVRFHKNHVYVCGAMGLYYQYSSSGVPLPIPPFVYLFGEDPPFVSVDVGIVQKPLGLSTVVSAAYGFLDGLPVERLPTGLYRDLLDSFYYTSQGLWVSSFCLLFSCGFAPHRTAGMINSTDVGNLMESRDLKLYDFPTLRLGVPSLVRLPLQLSNLAIYGEDTPRLVPKRLVRFTEKFLTYLRSSLGDIEVFSDGNVVRVDKLWRTVGVRIMIGDRNKWIHLGVCLETFQAFSDAVATFLDGRALYKLQYPRISWYLGPVSSYPTVHFSEAYISQSRIELFTNLVNAEFPKWHYNPKVGIQVQPAVVPGQLANAVAYEEKCKQPLCFIEGREFVMDFDIIPLPTCDENTNMILQDLEPGTKHFCWGCASATWASVQFHCAIFALVFPRARFQVYSSGRRGFTVWCYDVLRQSFYWTTTQRAAFLQFCVNPFALQRFCELAYFELMKSTHEVGVSAGRVAFQLFREAVFAVVDILCVPDFTICLFDPTPMIAPSNALARTRTMELFGVDTLSEVKNYRESTYLDFLITKLVPFLTLPDAPVTTSMNHVIRFPFSINADTGLLARPLDFRCSFPRYLPILTNSWDSGLYLTSPFAQCLERTLVSADEGGYAADCRGDSVWFETLFALCPFTRSFLKGLYRRSTMTRSERIVQFLTASSSVASTAVDLGITKSVRRCRAPVSVALSPLPEPKRLVRNGTVRTIFSPSVQPGALPVYKLVFGFPARMSHDDVHSVELCARNAYNDYVRWCRIRKASVMTPEEVFSSNQEIKEVGQHWTLYMMNHWCPYVDRYHKGNHCYIMVAKFSQGRNDPGFGFYRCFDQECSRHYRDNTVKLVGHL